MQWPCSVGPTIYTTLKFFVASLVVSWRGGLLFEPMSRTGYARSSQLGQVGSHGLLGG